jgi:hypothetical protein
MAPSSGAGDKKDRDSGESAKAPAKMTAIRLSPHVAEISAVVK